MPSPTPEFCRLKGRGRSERDRADDWRHLMSLKVLILPACTVTLAGGAVAASLRACIPDYQSEPFSSPAVEAPGQRLVAMAARRQGDDVRFLVAPWARCVAGIGSAQYDLIVGAEADEELLPSIVFPEKAGKPDTSRRLGSVEYVVVRKMYLPAAVSDRASRDGPASAIVPTSGYAAAKRLSASGTLTKAMNYDAGRFLSLLCRDRVDMVVLRRRDLVPAIGGCQPSQSVVIESFPLAVPEVYLGIRRSLLQSRPEFAESIWRELERIRSSTDWPPELAFR